MSQHFAVFGGSFDPPHFGHLRIIESALAELEIDKLFVVPTFLNPFKSVLYFSINDYFCLLIKNIKLEL